MDCHNIILIILCFLLGIGFVQNKDIPSLKNTQFNIFFNKLDYNTRTENGEYVYTNKIDKQYIVVSDKVFDLFNKPSKNNDIPKNIYKVLKNTIDGKINHIAIDPRVFNNISKYF